MKEFSALRQASLRVSPSILAILWGMPEIKGTRQKQGGKWDSPRLLCSHSESRAAMQAEGMGHHSTLSGLLRAL
jgi:hypothetical protein